MNILSIKKVLIFGLCMLAMVGLGFRTEIVQLGSSASAGLSDLFTLTNASHVAVFTVEEDGTVNADSIYVEDVEVDGAIYMDGAQYQSGVLLIQNAADIDSGSVFGHFTMPFAATITHAGMWVTGELSSDSLYIVFSNVAVGHAGDANVWPTGRMINIGGAGLAVDIEETATVGYNIVAASPCTISTWEEKGCDHDWTAGTADLKLYYVMKND